MLGVSGIKTNSSIQHQVISLPSHLHIDILGIRGGSISLGHQEGRADLSVEERLEPLLLLCVVAVLGQDFHVASVWSRTVHRFGGSEAAAQNFGH